MKIITVLGARPQFIKAAPVCFEFQKNDVDEKIIHTGQHYDEMMSQVFFKEMNIPTPAFQLAVGSGGHGEQTGKMLIEIEKILLQEKPDAVLVYGDTNSTLAGAIATCKLNIPLIHVEAGLRSFNQSMPEEHNRILTDHCSQVLMCPTQGAADQLKKEGITKNVHVVGDTMLDAVLHYSEVAKSHSQILKKLGFQPKSYVLATIHRPYNTDDENELEKVFAVLESAGLPVVLPIHPRTKARIASFGLKLPASITLIDPVGYFDMIALESNAKIIMTDSGGIQKEAFFLSVPCLTLRPETEWTETVDAGWNFVVDKSLEKTKQALLKIKSLENKKAPQIFGKGDAAKIMVNLIKNRGKLNS